MGQFRSGTNPCRREWRSNEMQPDELFDPVSLPSRYTDTKNAEPHLIGSSVRKKASNHRLEGTPPICMPLNSQAARFKVTELFGALCTACVFDPTV